MIPLPKQPKLIKKVGNIAFFEIEALYPGYGVTIGNALRRVLLSSLPGAAITQIKIKNAPHEFTTMDYVQEDVIQIILNLKKMRFKLHTNEPQRIFLHVSGEKEVMGKDFVLPSQVELSTKDLLIATLTDKKADFEMEAQVEQGLGYVPVEARVKETGEIGTIFLDALFSPVKRVSFRVEHMRVGDRTDYDRLSFEIETDGTIEAETALHSAVETLKNHFSLIEESFAAIDISQTGEASYGAQVEGGESAIGQEGWREEKEAVKKNVSDLGLSNRTANALVNNKVKTVGGLMRKSEKSLLQLEGMGEKGVEEIKKALEKLGLELRAE